MHRQTAGEQFSYSIDEFSPDYGWKLKPNLKREPFDGYVVSSDSSGLRSVSSSPRADTLPRFLFIGDSFTFGECVDDSLSFPAFVQQMMTGVKVLNMGVHGWGNDQMLMCLKREGQSYHPDIVVVGCMNDDLNRINLWFRDYAKPYYEIGGSDSLVLCGAPVLSPKELLTKGQFKLLDLLLAQYEIRFSSHSSSEKDKLAAAIMRETVLTIKGMNAIPVFVYLPWVEEATSGKSMPDKAFLKAISDSSVIWIDPTLRISQRLTGTQLEKGKNFSCHYTPLINQIIAECIVDALSKETRIKN